MTAIVPLTPTYTFSVSVPAEEVPRSAGAIDAFLVSHIARDLAGELADKGYDVGDLNTILEGSKITVDKITEPGHIIFLAIFPHPAGNSQYEMHPLRELVSELVGGERDGTRPPWRAGQAETIEYPNARYHRTGFNLADGSWQFQVEKNHATPKQNPTTDTDMAGADG